MSDLFEIEGADLHPGYRNLRAGVSIAEQAMRNSLQELWQTYEPFADEDFREGFARDPDARFWEMYLGCMLINEGKELLPTCDRLQHGGQPDICVLDNGNRIWIEAVAPTEGAPGPDQLRGPVPIDEGGGFAPMPVRQAQLRITSALYTKTLVMENYVNTGVISQDDVRLVAIGMLRFGLYVPEDPHPLILSSVFPIGDEFVSVNTATGQIVDRGFEESLSIQRQGGEIPRTAFLDNQFSDISGVIWSRISIGTMSRVERPITFVHNPLAKIPLQEGWGVWDKEYRTVEETDGWRVENIG